MVVTVDGNECVNETSSTGSATEQLSLFSTTGDICVSDITIHYFKAYQNGTLVLDLVPVIKGTVKNGEAAEQNGFYDNVSREFMYSSGAEFIASGIIGE